VCQVISVFYELPAKIKPDKDSYNVEQELTVSSIKLKEMKQTESAEIKSRNG
jgi:hypothetical protein